jgi:CRP-like cAMP-binding protein
VLGERSVLEGGKRSSTLRAITDCKVAVAASKDIDRDALQRLSHGHRREEEDG